jgi:hypothetical protein
VLGLGLEISHLVSRNGRGCLQSGFFQIQNRAGVCMQGEVDIGPSGKSMGNVIGNVMGRHGPPATAPLNSSNYSVPSSLCMYVCNVSTADLAQ